MPNEALKFVINRRLTEKQESTFIFVSAHPSEGKTFTSKQVADLFLNYFTSEKIALLDFDILNPTLSHQIGDPDLGWANAPVALGAKENNPDWLYAHPGPDQGNLFYIPVGKPKGNKLGSAETVKHIPGVVQALKQHFDLVLIDGPAVLQTSATLTMAAEADGVFLVVEAGRTRRQVVELALDQLRDAGASIVGVIMNKRRFFIPGWLYRRIF